MGFHKVLSAWISAATWRGLAAALIGLALLGIVPDRAVADTAYPGGIWEPGPPQYGFTTVTGIPVTMDDGVILRADIAYPTDLATGQRASGQFPVIVEHQPYTQPVNTYFAQYGYISVRISARGTGISGGNIEFTTARDGQDGVAIIDWAAYQLAGSDGRVGQIGCSFVGLLALTDAAHVGRNSPLKASVPSCAGLEQFTHETVLAGGIPTQTMNGFRVAGILTGGQPATIQFFNNLVTDVLAGGDLAYDRAFWKKRIPLSWARDIVRNDIPVLLWVGWGDSAPVLTDWVTSALQTYAALQNASQHRSVYAPMRSNQPTSPRYQIIVGNWGHGGGLDNGIMLEWFETWIRGVRTGLQKTKTPMHLYEQGTDRWINAARYPTVPAYTTWYLNEAGALTSRPAERRANDSLLWAEPIEVGARLSYTTPPLRSGATLSGPMSATVYATSSNTNLVLIATLYDVAPDGTTSKITRGAVLGSQRALDEDRSWTDDSKSCDESSHPKSCNDKSWNDARGPDTRGTLIRPWIKQTKDSYLTPGRVYRFDIALLPRQWGLQRNHRLRLELTTKTPADVCAAFQGSDPCLYTEPQLATVPGGVYSILHGPAWPSALNLPQLDAMAFRTATSGVTPTSGVWTEPLDWGNRDKDRH